jgi:hypothetical protein
MTWIFEACRLPHWPPHAIRGTTPQEQAGGHACSSWSAASTHALHALGVCVVCVCVGVGGRATWMTWRAVYGVWLQGVPVTRPQVACGQTGGPPQAGDNARMACRCRACGIPAPAAPTVGCCWQLCWHCGGEGAGRAVARTNAWGSAPCERSSAAPWWSRSAPRSPPAAPCSAHCAAPPAAWAHRLDHNQQSAPARCTHAGGESSTPVHAQRAQRAHSRAALAAEGGDQAVKTYSVSRLPTPPWLWGA